MTLWKKKSPSYGIMETRKQLASGTAGKGRDRPIMSNPQVFTSIFLAEHKRKCFYALLSSLFWKFLWNGAPWSSAMEQWVLLFTQSWLSSRFVLNFDDSFPLDTNIYNDDVPQGSFCQQWYCDSEPKAPSQGHYSLVVMHIKKHLMGTLKAAWAYRKESPR